jgi:hypothetical protein
MLDWNHHNGGLGKQIPDWCQRCPRESKHAITNSCEQPNEFIKNHCSISQHGKLTRCRFCQVHEKEP